jgi:hypothetical protein
MRNDIRMLLFQALFLCVFFCIAYSQILDPLQFFPHAVGNKWRWVNSFDGSVYTEEITHDSTGADGSKYLFRNKSTVPSYRIDTLFQLFQFQNSLYADGHVELGKPILLFKLNAVTGDSFSTDWGNVKVASYDVTIFGKIIKGKKFSWYINGVYQNERTLGFGFGLVSAYASPSIILLDQRLSGCIINGVAFGLPLSVQSESDGSPHQYYLNQNFPNPFNSNTKFSFSLPQSGFTSLKLFNILGEEVATIISEELRSGLHEKDWDASGYPSGIYFYRLHSGNFNATKKLILLL